MVSRCGIIGLGKIGMMYDLAIDKTKAVYTHCRSLSIHPNFEIAFAVDPLSSQREIFSQNYKKPVYVDLESASKEGNIDVAVIVGLVLRGETPHFDYVCQGVTQGVMDVSLSRSKPIGFGVLMCDNLEQATARAGLPGSKEDKGYDSALAALSVINKG